MKRILSVVLSIMLIGVAVPQTTVGETGNQAKGAKSEEMKTAGYKRYRIKSGVIEYDMTGTQKGTETLYFDRYGMREAKYTKAVMSVAGMTIKQNTLTILDGEWQYSIDLDKRTGTKTENPYIRHIGEQSGTKDFSDLSERFMTGMGGVKTGSEAVAGKTCDVWEIKKLNTKSWVWNWVPLKTQVGMAGMMITSTATKFEEGASVSDDKFAIPPDVKITQGQDVKKLLEGIKKGKKP